MVWINRIKGVEYVEIVEFISLKNRGLTMKRHESYIKTIDGVCFLFREKLREEK